MSTSLESLAIQLVKERKVLNKMDYKNPDTKEEFKKQQSVIIAISTKIQDNFGREELTKILIGKQRTDGKFKSLNSKGNGYGNM